VAASRNRISARSTSVLLMLIFDRS
jgi:hypothetical protein